MNLVSDRRLKKSLGQNFLTDKSVVESMVYALDLQKDDYVVEIGGGSGFVTDILLEELKSVDAKAAILELDERFSKELEEKYEGEEIIEVINVNVLDWLPAFLEKDTFKVIGSIPYYITSPIIHKIVKHRNEITDAVLLIQKEVAEKITYKCPDASYLSTFIQTFYDVDILEIVPSHLFKPEPKVDSAILKMNKIDNPLIKKSEVGKYEGFLHKGFSSPRKMLNKPFSEELLKKASIDGSLRPQNLEIAKWIELFKTRE
ncbi:16S rRNA (adenine(1518)-N(6)/adenine(1519)-N(6))-dimethyltransferase RsmA [Patescibacteria group bacterium]